MNESGGDGDLAVPGVGDLVEVRRSSAAATYRGTDGASGRPVVVTVLEVVATAEVRARFEHDQGQIATLIDHPGIVAVHRHGYTPDGRPWFVAEDVNGAILADRVGTLDGPGVLALGIGLAGALESAHRLQVFHGDLRPEDIVLGDAGQPVVADFGVATVTGRGPAQAVDPRRLAHAAPEQLRGSHPTPATDVYALGSVLYSLLAAEDAFVRPGDTSVVAVITRVTSEPAPDLRAKGVPDQVATVVATAMAKEAGERYASAEAMGRALQQAEVALDQPMTAMTIVDPAPGASPAVEATTTAAPAAASPGAESPAGGPPPGGPPVASSDRVGPPPTATTRRSKKLLIAAAVVVLALVGGVAVLVLGGGDDDRGSGDERGEGGDDADVAPGAPVGLVAVSDDTGAVSVDVPDTLGANGAAFPLTQDGIILDLPDVVAATDTEAFLAGFAIEGVEATGVPIDALAAAAGVDTFDASTLLDVWTTIAFDGRPGSTAEACTADGGPVERTTDGGFIGFEARFTGCDDGANDLVVFAGIADDGTTAVVVQVLAAPGGDLDRVAGAIIDSATVDAGLL